jgi:hypothetical protein
MHVAACALILALYPDTSCCYAVEQRYSNWSTPHETSKLLISKAVLYMITKTCATFYCNVGTIQARDSNLTNN